MQMAFATCHMGKVIHAYRTHPWHGSPVRQDTVARWLHLHRSQLSRIENQTATVDIHKMAHWAQLLGIPVDQLWFRLPQRASTPVSLQHPNETAALRPSTSDRSPLDRGALSQFQESNADGVEASQQAWHVTRQHLVGNRTALAQIAKTLYATSWLLPDTPTLTCDAWLPDEPIPLEEVTLQWEPNAASPIILGQEPRLRPTLPLRAPGQPFPTYSSAIRYLRPPTL